MRLPFLLPALAFGVFACAPAVGTGPAVTPAESELRYRLVLERVDGGAPVTDAAAARMALGIERALASRGMLRAAEWEEPTLTVSFRMQDEGAPSREMTLQAPNTQRTERGGCAGADFTPDHCSQLEAVPVMPAVPGFRTPGTVSLQITTIGADPQLVWSESRIERTSWRGIGQRRADEIARGMVRDLDLTHES